MKKIMPFVVAILMVVANVDSASAQVSAKWLQKFTTNLQGSVEPAYADKAKAFADKLYLDMDAEDRSLYLLDTNKTKVQTVHVASAILGRWINGGQKIDTVRNEDLKMLFLNLGVIDQDLMGYGFPMYTFEGIHDASRYDHTLVYEIKYPSDVEQSASTGNKNEPVDTAAVAEEEVEVPLPDPTTSNGNDPTVHNVPASDNVAGFKTQVIDGVRYVVTTGADGLPRFTPFNQLLTGTTPPQGGATAPATAQAGQIDPNNIEFWYQEKAFPTGVKTFERGSETNGEWAKKDEPKTATWEKVPLKPNEALIITQPDGTLDVRDERKITKAEIDARYDTETGAPTKATETRDGNRGSGWAPAGMVWGGSAGWISVGASTTVVRYSNNGVYQGSSTTGGGVVSHIPWGGVGAPPGTARIH